MELEQKYGIEIMRIKPDKPIPLFPVEIRFGTDDAFAEA